MCMIEDADGMVTVLSSRQQKARKQHRCSECYRMIESGEQYLYEATYFDSEFRAYKTCAHCLVVRNWLLDNCSGFVYGDLAYDLGEHDSDSFGMARMKYGINHKWQRKSGRLMRVPQGE